MSESGALATSVGTPKIKSLKVKSTKKATAHPPTASLVNNAIKHLNERGGSSLQAIKKYISSTYKIDAEKIAPFVKKYLKSGVEKGVLIRTKGTGASGSFKLAAGKVEGPKKVASKKPKAVATPKKASKPKKKVASKKPKSVKPKKAKKSPSKTKKSAKAPAAKKPKAPKPKKAAPKKVAKKVAAKK